MVIWKYVVTYMIVKTVYVACPTPPKHDCPVDEFGEVVRHHCPDTFTNAALCHEKVSYQRSNEFTDRQKAVDFMLLAREKEETFLSNYSIKDIELDSIKLE